MEATQESWTWILLVLAGMVVLPALVLWVASLGAFGPVAVPIEQSSEASESSGEVGEAAATSQPSAVTLEAHLTAPCASLATDSVQIEVAVANHSEVGAYLLTWYTPLEGLRGDIFRVERDGRPIPYEGPLVVRGNPTREDYVFLDAGEALSCTVDLAAVGETNKPPYAFSEPGKYTISFKAPAISHVASTERQIARHLEELGPITIPSNRVTVEIASIRQSRSQAEGAPVDPAAGLVFSTAEELWRIDLDGTAVLLIAQPGAQVSPDGSRAVFSAGFGSEEGSDVWLADLETGARHNVTKTPDRDEVNAMWWPGRPEIIAFGSGAGLDMLEAGHPTVAGTDGSGYEVLDTEEGGPLALSPDGKMAAYGGYDGLGRIYRWGVGPEPFDPARYGIAVEKLYEPAWNPDGRRLAWKVGGDLTGEGRWQIGIAMFDLYAETVELVHVYEPVGGSFQPYLAWSPDGEWLAFATYQEPPSSGRLPNLWVVPASDGEKAYLGAGVDPTWSPDGRQLAFTVVGEDSLGIAVADVGDWQVQRVDVPHRIQSVRSWVAPRPATTNTVPCDVCGSPS